MKHRALLFILVLASGLRVVGMDHSLPYRYVPDTHMIRGALGMAQEKNLAPPASKYTSYPYLMPYVLLPEFGVLYAGGRVLGAWDSADAFGAKMIDDPTPLYRIARAIIALFGVLGVYLAYRIGGRVGGSRAAWMAALLVATSFLLVHLGKSARPWVPMTTLVLLTADRSLAWLRRPGWKRMLSMGAAAGLSLACHQAGGLAVLLVGSAVVARLRTAPGKAVLAAVGSALAFLLVALFVGFPYLMRGESADVGVDAVGGENAVNFGGQGMAFDQFGVDRFKETFLGFLTAEPAILALLLLSLLVARPRFKRPGMGWVLLVYPVVVVGLFLFYKGTHVRYLSPAVPLLAIVAATGASRVWDRSGWLRVVIVLILLFPLVQVTRLALVMREVDTRTEFLATIARLVPPGARIGLEGYGPPLRVNDESLRMVREAGRWVSRGEEREAAGETPAEEDRPGYAVVPIERFYEFASVWPHQYGLPGDAERVDKDVEVFLDEMEIGYLVRVDRHPGGPQNSAFDEILSRRGEKLAELHPFRDGDGPGEAMLPMDPELPLFAVWGVDRPGPSLTLWRVR